MIDFGRLDSRTDVRCETIDQAIAFYEELRDQYPQVTVYWKNIGDVVNAFDQYEDEFCFVIDGGYLMYSEESFYKNEGYTIVCYDSLIEDEVDYDELEDISSLL